MQVNWLAKSSAGHGLKRSKRIDEIGKIDEVTSTKAVHEEEGHLRILFDYNNHNGRLYI